MHCTGSYLADPLLLRFSGVFRNQFFNEKFKPLHKYLSLALDSAFSEMVKKKIDFGTLRTVGQRILE